MTPANDDARALAISKFRDFVCAISKIQAEAVGWGQVALDLAECSQQCLEQLFAEHPELRPDKPTDPEDTP